MNIEIEYKGKRVDNGKWAYGYYYVHEPPLECIMTDDYVSEQSKHYILNTAFADWSMPRQVEFIEIIPETKCQYVGKKDKRGTKIYEGDLLGDDDVDIWEVVWNKEDASYQLVISDVATDFSNMDSKWLEVIGNIHDDKELLEVKE